jgi:peroxiredoxin 2/4
MLNCQIGQKAPLFELVGIFPDGSLQQVALQKKLDHRKWTILIFYPKDFTRICPTEITSISDRYDEFEELTADVIGVSMDPIDVHEKWMNTPRSENGVQGLAFPLCSDIDASVTKSFGVFNAAEQLPFRALFIINPFGELQYMTVFHNNIGRDVDETLRVLQALQTGGLCPANWKPGNDVYM